MTGDTGIFWFFSSGNVEMIVKIVDGRAVNSRFWVFAGGLTDVDVVMTVLDTQTGLSKTYHNPQGHAFEPIQDTGTFLASAASESVSRLAGQESSTEEMQIEAALTAPDLRPSTLDLRPSSSTDSPVSPMRRRSA